MGKENKAKVTNSRMDISCGYRMKDGAECSYSCPSYHRARLAKHTKKHHPAESDILIRGSAVWVSEQGFFPKYVMRFKLYFKIMKCGCGSMLKFSKDGKWLV